jgi:hypothetical protein
VTTSCDSANNRSRFEQTSNVDGADEILEGLIAVLTLRMQIAVREAGRMAASTVVRRGCSRLR